MQGAVIAAIGSSFPKLSTTVISTLVHGTFELGIASIVGLAIFNILVIPGLSVLVGGRLRVDLNLVYKDAQFYIIAVATLLLAFSSAVIYNPAPEGELVGMTNRTTALIPVLLYGLLQQQDVREQWQRKETIEETPTEDREEDDQHIRPLREWGLLVWSLLVIVVGVEGLVQSALGLGELLGTPSFLWGLTIVAAGTSLPDTFVSVRAARKGEGDVSLANVLGSNIFDLLIAIPVGVLIAGTTPINFVAAAPMMGFLIVATIVFFTALRLGLSLGRPEAWLWLGLYAVFIGWTILETFGVTSVVFLR